MATDHEYRTFLAFLRESGGSSTPVIFDYTATEDTEKVWNIHVYIEDSGTLDAGTYGAISPTAALTNGMSLQVVWADGTVEDLFAGDPVKTNANWAQHAEEVTLVNWGAGNNAYSALLRFPGPGLTLLAGDKVRMIVNDDLTPLIIHTAQVQGTRY